MPDLILKQVVAVIDARTTTICLHAAGQIRPIDEPFDTLLGEQDETPFHVHCRSMVVPWMSGFVSDIRAASNAELLRRPLKQRRLGPNGEGPKLPPKPRPTPGLPGSSAAKVTKSTDEFLKGATGREALDDVPAEHRKAFVEAHPERFTMESNGGGISETYWVRDVQTGDRYVLKAGQYHNESIAEVIGTRVQAQVGFRGEVLIASDMRSGNGWVLLKHAEDLAESKAQGAKVIGTSGSHGAQAKLAPRLADPTEAVRKLVVDFAIDEADAKGGNMLLMSVDGGKTVRLVPIDRSLSQMGWREAVEPGKTSIVAGDWSLEGRLAVQDLRSYMKTRGSPKGVLELVQDLAEKPGGARLVTDAYDDAVSVLKRIDLDEMTEGIPARLVQENRRLIARRIELLEEQRDTILRQMGVQAKP